MHRPLVSVLLPVFNGGPYLGEAVGSVLRQDYENLEIIAINDGSTDDSLRILEHYRQTDRRIKLISRENRGLVATLNEGLRLAGGDLVARMDADDIAYPTRLSRQVKAFAEQPGLAICGTGVDALVGTRLIRGMPDPIFRQCSLQILSLFFTIFIHSTVMFNRRVIPDDALFYDPRYPHAEDFDLFRRTTALFPSIMLPESLVAYRSHEDSVTSRHKHLMRKTHLAIVAENLDQTSLLDKPDALTCIAETMTMDTIERVAEVILKMNDAVSRLPADVRPSYEAGSLNLFYFLYQMIIDLRQPRMTHAFLTRTTGWSSIRRREQYALRLGAGMPWLSLAAASFNRQFDAVSRYIQSEPASGISRSC